MHGHIDKVISIIIIIIIFIIYYYNMRVLKTNKLKYFIIKREADK